MDYQIGVSNVKWGEMDAAFAKEPVTSNEFPSKGYYYTTVETLEKILQSGAIYSTNYRYLNDPGEWAYGYPKLIEACREELQNGSSNYTKKFYNLMKKILFEENFYLNDHPEFGNTPFYNNFSEIFTISFTEEEDLISQWVRYAKESGVVLELDFSLLGDALFLYQETLKERKIKVQTRARKVAYRDKEISMIAQKVMEELQKEYEKLSYRNPVRMKPHIYMYIRYFASYIKNTAYEQEKEMRISLMPLVNEQSSRSNIDKSGIKYTIQNGVYVPHIPLYFGRQRGKEIIKCGLPIRSIRVGPGYNQESVYLGLVHRLECGEKNVCLLSEKEQRERKIRFIIEGLAEYFKIKMEESASSRKIAEDVVQKLSQDGELIEFAELKTKLESILSTSKDETMLDASYNELKYLKQTWYNQIFKEIELKSYCTADGILIKRSRIPYIFSKK